VHIGPGKVELAPAAAPPVSMEAPDAKDPSRRTTGLTVPADQVFFSEGVRIALPSGVLDAEKKKVTRPWSRTTFMLFCAAMAATAVDDSPTPFSRDAMMRFKSAVLGPLVGLVLFALAAPSLDAQSVWGIRGGVSVASASFSTDTFDADNRTGFMSDPSLVDAIGGVARDWGIPTGRRGDSVDAESESQPVRP
jgi:hypothetical protein